MTGGASQDWIELFLDYTEGIPSPEIFRLWSGITAVAGALERRVWIEASRGVIYPNLYTLLVGRPGVGKSQAIARTYDLWYATNDLKVAPDSVTKASLIDAINAADRKIILNETSMIEFHSLQVAALEFGVLVPAHDLEFLNALNHIFDNPPNYRENRRMFGNKQIDISNPQLTILAGTQPTYLATLLPEEAWGMGFTSRLIMVYSSEAAPINLFDNIAPREKEYDSLLAGMKGMLKLHGRVDVDEKSKVELTSWAKAGCPPIPQHSKLENYNARRILHALKLSLISAVSGGRSIITLYDVERAKMWLTSAERLMPDIFRDMIMRSDAQIIQELYLFTWQLWVKEKAPIHESRLIHFLQTRVPSEKVMRLLEIVERSNMITRDAGTQLYTPRPTNQHGVE